MQEGRHHLAIDATIWHAIAAQTSVSIQTFTSEVSKHCVDCFVSWQQVLEFESLHYFLGCCCLVHYQFLLKLLYYHQVGHI
jgi:hypothetical protein